MRLAGLRRFRSGRLVSTRYFIVIPIMPARKQPNIAMARMRPILVVAVALTVAARKTPRARPDRLPMRASRMMSGRLAPKSTCRTKMR